MLRLVLAKWRRPVWSTLITRYREKCGPCFPQPRNDRTPALVPLYRAEVRSMVEAHNADNLIAGTQRAVLIEGGIFKTIPEFLKEQPGLKISLLHFDMDLYEPTKFALEQLYPLVVEGGAVCFDEYGLIPWQGETRAVDDYFAHRPNKPVIRKHPFAQTPHGYFIKRD